MRADHGEGRGKKKFQSSHQWRTWNAGTLIGVAKLPAAAESDTRLAEEKEGGGK